VSGWGATSVRERWVLRINSYLCAQDLLATDLPVAITHSRGTAGQWGGFRPRRNEIQHVVGRIHELSHFPALANSHIRSGES
jgi:hypothetical protein